MTKKKQAPRNSTPSPAPKAAGRSVLDFRAEHDKSFIVPQRIREGIKKLGEGWEYEVGFLRLSGLSTTDLAAYRDEFSEFTVMVGGRNPKRVWAGSKELAAQLRQMVA